MSIDPVQQSTDEHFMQQALDQARKALAEKEFPVGCVLVRGKEILAKGCRQNSEGTTSNEVDHAEVVTLRRLLAVHPGMDCSDITVYCTMEPCLMCYATLLLSGIRRFVWGYEDIMGGGTRLPLAALPPLYREMNVELVPSVLRYECLDLFGCFFEKFSYWQGSLLAEYTREQLLRKHNVS